MLKNRSYSQSKKREKKIDRTRSKREQSYLTETKDFAGVIEKVGAGNKLRITSPDWYQDQINKFRDGEKVTLYISSRKPKRTLAQNSYYWGVYLPLVARETGEPSVERLHKLFAGMFLTEDIVEVLGHKVRMVKSTTVLSKNDFSEYIMKIEAETGVQAPPTENYF